MPVNWLEVEIRNPAGQITCRNRFITDLPVERDTVAELAACGRARCKIENETFNVLKTSGYHLEHSFGQGKQNLAALLVTLNLLAFAFHTVCDQTIVGGDRPEPRLAPAPGSSATSRPSQPSWSSPHERISCGPRLSTYRRPARPEPPQHRPNQSLPEDQPRRNPPQMPNELLTLVTTRIEGDTVHPIPGMELCSLSTVLPRGGHGWASLLTSGRQGVPACDQAGQRVSAANQAYFASHGCSGGPA
jgi:hypothetical protein